MQLTQRRTNFTLPGEIPLPSRSPGYFAEGTTSRKFAEIFGTILIGRATGAAMDGVLGAGPSIPGPSGLTSLVAQVGLGALADTVPGVSTFAPAIMYGVGVVERKLTGN